MVFMKKKQLISFEKVNKKVIYLAANLSNHSIMLKLNQIYLPISILYILSTLSCQNNVNTNTTESTPQNYEMIVAALQNVQDSLQLNEADFERVNDIIIKYENESREVKKQKFNNPKSKQQVMQNLLKSRRAELSDVLKPKQMMTFNKLYKESLANERRNAQQEKQLSKEDHKALSQEIQTYRKESVMPVIAEQRRALEAAMSLTDKTQITSLREKTQAFNKALSDKKATCAAIKQTNKPAKVACRRELRNLQKNQEPIAKEFEQLITLLEEKPGTQTIMSAMDTKRDVWRADLKKILDTYTEQKLEADKIPLRKYFRLAPTSAFLLLDPANINQPVPELDSE